MAAAMHTPVDLRPRLLACMTASASCHCPTGCELGPMRGAASAGGRLDQRCGEHIGQKLAPSCSWRVGSRRLGSLHDGTKRMFGQETKPLQRGNGGLPLVRALWGQQKQETSKLPQGLQPITSEEDLDDLLKEADEKGTGVVIEWMAQWCRKCIYLQPKIEKLALEYPNMQFCVVDVNAVPSSLVKRAEVTKMPTIQFWRDKKWQAEVVGGHKAWMVLDEIREMLGKFNRSS